MFRMLLRDTGPVETARLVPDEAAAPSPAPGEANAPLKRSEIEGAPVLVP